MFVKIFQHILDGSLAQNRPLRHFFTDLLICANSDGNVMKTKEAIARAINCSVDEVEWGLAELMKPDPFSGTPDHEGRRVIPIEGTGYGWHIVNYQLYRGLKSADDLRKANRDRVQRWREANSPKPKRKHYKTRGGPLPGEESAVRQMENGNVALADAITTSHLPASAQQEDGGIL